MPASDDDPDGWDADSVFALGRADHELSPDEQQQRRRSKRFAIGALGAVVVVVAVAITLVALLVDTSTPLSSPAAVAQQWASDLVRSDTAGRRQLECPEGVRAGDVLSLMSAADGVRAGRVRRTGGSSWRIRIFFLGPDGVAEASFSVEVVRRGGRYLVC